MNENGGFEKAKSAAVGYAKNYAGYAAVVLLVLAYTSMALFQIGKTDKTVWQIVADGTTAMLLGVAVARLFSLQGILRGKQTVEYLQTAQLHGQVVTEIAPYIDRLDAWCEKKTEEMLRLLRTRILLSGGLCYDECFENGAAKGYAEREIPSELLPLDRVKGKAAKILERRKAKQLKRWQKEERARRRCYRRAVRASITPLLSGVLTGSYIKISDPFNFGKSVAEYEAANTKNGILIRIISACLFGYFGVELIRNFTWEDLLYRLLQVAIALAFGVIQQYRSFLYVTEEKRGHTIKKIDYLQMFLADQKGREEREVDHGGNV